MRDLTKEEQDVLDDLTAAWNKFIKLPSEGRYAQRLFQDNMNMLQMNILARPASVHLNELGTEHRPEEWPICEDCERSASVWIQDIRTITMGSDRLILPHSEHYFCGRHSRIAIDHGVQFSRRKK